MKKHLFFGLLTTIMAGSVIYFMIPASKSVSQGYKSSPVIVQLARVEAHNIPLIAQATGQLMAPRTVLLKSQMSGVVSRVSFTNGQTVKAGQLLLSLNSTQQQANMRSALADYTKAKTQLQRTRKLYREDKAVSKSELDNAEAANMQFKAKYDDALYQLSNMQIKAPFDGVLTSADLSKGSYVSVGETLVSVIDKKNLELDYTLPESYAENIKLGQVVNFTTDALPNKTFQAKVNYISPDVSSANLTFSIRAKFDNIGTLLSPGMSIYVEQVLKQDNKVLSIPERAIHAKSGGFVVYIIVKGAAKKISIKIGQIDKGYVSILSGLKKGQKVVVTAQGNLSDGSDVKVEK